METCSVMSEDLYRVINDALVTSAYIGNEDWEHDVTGYGEERCLAIRFEYISDYTEFIFRVQELYVSEYGYTEWHEAGLSRAVGDVEVYSDNTYAFKHLVTRQQITKTIGIGGYEVS